MCLFDDCIYEARLLYFSRALMSDAQGGRSDERPLTYVRAGEAEK
jgi:hypothetical protein